LLLDIHDRLKRRDLISRPTFNLPLTQEQIGDHLGLTVVHVNRTLRRLREERVLMMDRQVVIIHDLDALREIGEGLPPLFSPGTAALRLAPELNSHSRRGESSFDKSGLETA
jgi:hypothetical protein